MRLLRRIRYLLNSRANDRALDEELAFHCRLAEQAHHEQGISAAEARAAARRQMGNMTLAREDAREVWLWPLLSSVAQDVRYGARALLKQPGFTALAVAALALGIGLNTSLFTVFNAAALRPWPVRDPGRVVVAASYSVERPSQFGGFSVAEYRYLRDHTRALSGVVALRNEGVMLDGQSLASHASCDFVSTNYFDVLGVVMAAGRPFRAEDEAVAVLSFDLWQKRYGGAADVIGRRIRVDDVPFTVIGVASEEFTGTSPNRHDVWVPLAALPLARPHDPFARDLLAKPDHCCVEVAGRLAAGESRASAQAELTLLSSQFHSGLREKPRGLALAGTSFAERPGGKRAGLTVMYLLMAATAAVLLLACANVGNLLLARAAARQREIAVRLSLGASRRRVIRQLLTESLLLAAIAGGLGLLLAFVLPGRVLAFFTQSISVNLRPDSTVLLYSTALALTSAIAFGLAPALRATRALQTVERLRLRGVLLGVQVTISVVLLASAALLVRGLERARSLNPGFDTRGVTMLMLDLPVNRYDEARGQEVVQELRQRVEAITGPDTVAVSRMTPLGNSRSLTDFTLRGRSQPMLFQHVSAPYFRVLGIPLLAGRHFTDSDGDRGPVIVNEALARRYWPGESAVGKVFNSGAAPREVIGVAADAQVQGLGPVEPLFFVPYRGGRQTTLLIRDESGVLARGNTLGSLAAELEPQATATVRAIADQVERWLGPSRVGAAMAGALGLLALTLATIGVYGVIAYSVAQRRREIGVRIAVGAKPGQVVSFVLRGNARPALAGAAAGAALAVAVSQVLADMFFGLSPLDAPAWAGVLVVLLIAAATASVVPARQAARLDPVEALREQ
jgi:predicted permease